MIKLFLLFLISCSSNKIKEIPETYPQGKSYVNKCFTKKNARRFKVQELLHIKSYKKGSFLYNKYSESTNSLFFNESIPYRPNGKIKLVFNGQYNIKFYDLTIAYKIVRCDYFLK